VGRAVKVRQENFKLLRNSRANIANGIVLDTSVLISALETKNPKRSPAWRVLKALRTGEITNFISKEIAEEMQEKLLVIGDEVGRPNVADYKLTMVRPRRKFSDDPEFLKNLRDPNDARFFDVAYAKKVDYIISETRSTLSK